MISLFIESSKTKCLKEVLYISIARKRQFFNTFVFILFLSNNCSSTLDNPSFSLWSAKEKSHRGRRGGIKSRLAVASWTPIREQQLYFLRGVTDQSWVGSNRCSLHYPQQSQQATLRTTLSWVACHTWRVWCAEYRRAWGSNRWVSYFTHVRCLGG